jgi:hypothetical protein
MHRRLLATMVAFGLAVTACSGDDSDGADNSPSTALTLLPTTIPPTTTEPPATTTTLPATTTTAATTTTTVAQPTTTVVDPAVTALVLSGEGIGSAGFGAETDGVISFISSYLGQPTNDTGWIDPLTVGPCPGDDLRFVSWGVLTLLFGDVSDVVQGRRHFFAYTYGIEGEIGAEPDGLVTSRGVTIGSRVVDVVAAYPAATLTPEDDFTPPLFFVNDNLKGFLTGLDDNSTVTAILGGVNCGL